MLSDTTFPVIKATLPLVADRIGEITPLFYQKLLAAHPELLNGVFSRANQANGEQRKALAGAIAAFAAHLVQNPGTFPEAVLSRISHKHASLGITPDQYEVVYKYLFEAIAEDLGEAVTAEVADAWSEVYWLMADALIKIETGLYAQQANNVSWSPWRVVTKTAASASAITFVLEPADETPVTPGKPGQFVSVRIPVGDGLLQARQYSLSADAECTDRRVFTTKYNDGGEVSPILRANVGVGDLVELSNPYGDITLEDTDRPLILATAGIGCTPSASILRSLANVQSTREVLVLHAERNIEAWALGEQMLDDIGKIDDAELHLWLQEPATDPIETASTMRKGRMSLADVELPQDANLYVCGPVPFMQKIRSEALALGIPARRIYYEVFGPDMWLASVA